MSVAETRVLRDLHEQVRTAVADIIRPRRYLDTYHWGASLLDQLREATSNGTEKGTSGANAPFGSKPLLCIAAWDLYRQTDKDWRTKGETLEQSFRLVPEWTESFTDIDALRKILVQLHGVIRAIRYLLDPPRHFHVAASCPACGARTVFRPDETGELVQQAALTVDGEIGCVCLSCRHVWPPDRLSFLAAVLGCDNLPTLG